MDKVYGVRISVERRNWKEYEKPNETKQKKTKTRVGDKRI